MFFYRRQKSKYRWFKVEGFGGGGLVGSGWWWWWQTLVVSQRKSCVTLCKTFRNHVNAATEASSCAKLFASEISWFNYSAIARGFSTQQLNYFDEIHSDIQKLEVIKQRAVLKGLYKITKNGDGRILDKKERIVWAK